MDGRWSLEEMAELMSMLLHKHGGLFQADEPDVARYMRERAELLEQGGWTEQPQSSEWTDADLEAMKSQA